jgi:type VI secretion system protein ImpJ
MSEGFRSDSSRARLSRQLLIDGAELPQPLRWSEGMLLAPQHFQWLSVRQEMLLQYRAASVEPFHWGVRRFTTDQGLLTGGELRVVELEATLPDGLVVTYSAASRATDGVEPLLLNLKTPELLTDPSPRLVYLCVAPRIPGADVAPRFSTLQRNVRDELDSTAEELPLELLQPKLLLSLSPPSAGEYIGMPIARVAARLGAFTLEDYEPPRLAVTEASRVFGLCANVAARLREKAVEVSRQADSLSAADQLDRAEVRGTLQALFGQLPSFEALLFSGGAHPFRLYVALSALVGQIATLSESLPERFRPYDHDDLLASFKPAIDTIHAALDHSFQETFLAIRFTPDAQDFVLNFSAEWASSRLLLGVRAPFGATDDQMSGWVAESIIGSRSQLGSFELRRMMGLRRTRIERDAGLIPPRGETLYALSPGDGAAIPIPGEDLVIRNVGKSGSSRPDEIVLYVSKKPGTP